MAENRPAVRFETVDDDCDGQRIDNFLMSRLKGLPRTRLYRLLRKGEVRVNKRRIKVDYRVKAGDIVRIPPMFLPETPDAPIISERRSDQLTGAIVFEDDDWLVVNKPYGIAVHGGSGLSYGLIEAMRRVRDDCRFLELCHRIDRDTSGCVVIAKKRSALKRFHAALREKTLEKRYWALVCGRWPAAVDAMNVALEKNVLQSGERLVKASADGKASRTLFSIIRKFDSYTLIEAQPITGRTHQIRVHAKIAGSPIVGDVKYGIDAVNEQFKQLGRKELFLHAKSVELPLDGGKRKVVESPLPDYWDAAMSELRLR